MNKDEAISYMVLQIEEIERDRIAANMSIDPQKQKKEVVDNILKVLKGVQITDEDQ